MNLKINPCFIKIDVEGFDHFVLKGMKKILNKYLPVLLIEYNYSNFKIIIDLTKKKYDCYRYKFETNCLSKLKKSEINKLLDGKVLERKYIKNSVNLFYIKKNFKLKKIKQI